MYGMFFVFYPTGPSEGALFVEQLRTEKQTENVASDQNGCARTTLSRQLNKMRQLQGTIILEANFIYIYVLKFFFFPQTFQVFHSI